MPEPSLPAPLPICVWLVGTDTDVGKTVATAALARAAHAAGWRALAIKPVQTGCAPDNAGVPHAPDIAVYRDACPQTAAQALVLLRDAASPHLAARAEHRRLRASALAGSLRDACRAFTGDLALMEGAGGVCAPINESETLLDVMRLLDMPVAPVVLVVGNRLGAVNHALLSLAALRSRGLPPVGFILAQPRLPRTRPGEDALLAQRILEDNRDCLIRLGALPCLAELPHIAALRHVDAAQREEGWETAASALRPVIDVLAKERAGACPDNAAALLHFDREHVWHPYAPAVAPLAAREVAHTRGARIVLRDGTELVDGMASWWCAIHGYAHPRLTAALHAQARMPHVMFGGLTHEPAVNLARRLIAMAPAGLEHVFFADSGSVAVEVALKMALQWQQAAGRPEKTRVLALRGGYHGDTLGAMSVCDPITGMHSLFRSTLPQQHFAPRPSCRFDSPYDPASALALEAILEQHADIAALILEPILQGAGGMWMYHPDYLSRVAALCRAKGCLLIADEIAVGFGRTGKLFACDWAAVKPDILCVGKALTGGVMTLAATLATGEVAQGVSRDGGALMHGPTFMANPLACAVAGASLELLDDGVWQSQVRRIEQVLLHALAPCRDNDAVADVRVLGAVGVLEMRQTVDVERVQAYCIARHGVWLRPFGRNIYAMPPYVLDEEELTRLADAMRGAAEAEAAARMRR